MEDTGLNATRLLTRIQTLYNNGNPRVSFVPLGLKVVHHASWQAEDRYWPSEDVFPAGWQPFMRKPRLHLYVFKVNREKSSPDYTDIGLIHIRRVPLNALASVKMTGEMGMAWEMGGSPVYV
jgi:hypothetical protein